MKEYLDRYRKRAGYFILIAFPTDLTFALSYYLLLHSSQSSH